MIMKIVFILSIFMLFESECKIEDETELVMTFLVHRHGDRTPLQPYLKFSNNPKALGKAIQGYGFGQLTKTGRKKALELGKFIRKRYNDLLSPYFNSSELIIRSTDYIRTKMSALCVTSGIYPRTNESVWIPAPYTTVPIKQDIFLSFLNCPKYMAMYKKFMHTNITEMRKHGLLLKELHRYVDFDISSPASVYMVYDLLKSQESAGVPLHPQVRRLLPLIKKAAADANRINFEQPDSTRLAGGPILNEFLDLVAKVKSQDNVPRVNIYSGHDFDVAALAAAAKVVPGVGVPEYSSAIALELRKSTSPGADKIKYFIAPVYLESPGSDLKHLEIDGCGPFCEESDFKNITQEYRINFTEWRKECGFVEELETSPI